MKIGVIGDKLNLEEVQSRITNHDVIFVSTQDLTGGLENLDCVFHFTIDENPDHLESLRELTDLPVFLNSVKTSLAELAYLYGNLGTHVYGFNGLPGFFNRSVLEVTLQESDADIKGIMDPLGLEYLVVADRVGMATPRVIAMIINEAYYTLQEDTATAEDIDLGMKLGTNYPFGPFEWAKKIGVHHIYELLESLYQDTKDQRYKISPLLKREYLLLQHS